MNQKASSEKPTNSPAWATEPFERFLDQAVRLTDVVRLSVRGISGLRSVPKIVQALGKVHEKEGTAEHKQQLAMAQADADLAQREIDSDFPIVFANATVALWSFLESMSRATAVAWLKNDPSVWQVDVIAKLRVRLGEYERLTQDERYHYVAELVESETATGLRNGIERFEAILKPFGLDGPVPGGLRRDMFEFGQVRNAIVHRGGHTDRQLISSCPWLNFKVGDELPIRREHFDRYGKATQNYVLLLICRVAEHFGKDFAEYKKAVFADYGTA